MKRPIRPGPLMRIAACLGILCAASGCANRPAAPALLDSPLYQNKQEGFRFEAPDGWRMSSRAEYPPGRAEKERLLVEYRSLRGDRLASLIVTMIDLPESADLGAYLHGREFVKPWKNQPAVSLEVDGRPAQRFIFVSGPGKEAPAQEVVAMRRGERVYFFTGAFSSGDNKSRDQIRKAVASLSW
jgi:hypothetical protein